MKNVIVTGLECSGTKLMTRIIGQHPGIEAFHTSLPVGWMPDTHLPCLEHCDSLLWMIRYEGFRSKSISIRGFESGRPPNFIGKGLIDSCRRSYGHLHAKTMFIPYEGIIGPMNDMILRSITSFIGVEPFDFDLSFVSDENFKYLTGLTG